MSKNKHVDHPKGESLYLTSLFVRLHIISFSSLILVHKPVKAFVPPFVSGLFVHGTIWNNGQLGIFSKTSNGFRSCCTGQKWSWARQRTWFEFGCRCNFSCDIFRIEGGRFWCPPLWPIAQHRFPLSRTLSSDF